MNELNDRITALTGYDLPAMSQRLGMLVKQREDAKAKLDYLREMRKVILDTAALTWSGREERDMGKRPSEARAEKEGRTSLEYRTQLDAIEQAHREYGSLLSQASALENEMWAARMAVSFAKTELQNRD